jgi:tetratricopeptide (TPR) repeat protein
VGALALAGGVLLAGWFLWLRLTKPSVPSIDLTDVDPEVVETLTQAREAVLNKPSSGQAWGKLGMVLTGHEYYKEAVPCFAQAEQLDPKEPRWPYLLGMCLFTYDRDAALPWWDRAVKRCHDDILAPRLRLAEALLERGQLDEAQEHLQQALVLAPDNPRVQLSLGRLAILRGQWRKALEPLAACVQDGHATKQAHGLRAQAFYRLGDRKQAAAEEAKAEALAGDEDWPDPYLEEAFSLQRGLYARIQEADELVQAGRVMQAIEHLQQRADSYPRALKLWMRLGDYWQKASRADKAEECYRKAVEVDPGAVDGWFQMASSQSTSRPREAADSLRRALRLRPDYTAAYLRLGECLQRLEDRPGAIEAFRSALRCDPTCTQAKDALKKLQPPSGVQ